MVPWLRHEEFGSAKADYIETCHVEVVQQNGDAIRKKHAKEPDRGELADGLRRTTSSMFQFGLQSMTVFIVPCCPSAINNPIIIPDKSQYSPSSLLYDPLLESLDTIPQPQRLDDHADFPLGTKQNREDRAPRVAFTGCKLVGVSTQRVYWGYIGIYSDI